MRNIIPVLKSLGLLESEVKTYLAALELGPSTVLEINKKIGLSRQAIYTAIESLIAIGLMSSVEKGKKTVFAAESPERLRSYAEAKLKKMESTVREMKDITKDLTLIQRGEKPVVKMFEGKEGLVSLLQELVNTKPHHIDEFTNEDAIAKILTENDLKPIKDYLDKSRATTNLLSKSSNADGNVRKFTKRKVLTRKDINVNADITVYNDKVAFMTFSGNGISVLIDSKDIADAVRSLFKLAWDNEKK
jgi:sugar-specific transcriptional regulator TrmB